MAWHSLGWTPAFFSEIEPFPSAVLAHHYGSNMPGEPLAKNGIPNYGDFTKIAADAGPVDLLVGGTRFRPIGRTEALWINPACWSALTIERGGHSAGQETPLFSIAGGAA